MLRYIYGFVLCGVFVFFLPVLQALPEDKKPLSAELFWLTFRLHAGLPLSPRDPHAGVDDALGESGSVGDLFENDDIQRHGNREKALLVLCSFAEGGYKRKKDRVRGTQPAFSWQFSKCICYVSSISFFCILRFPFRRKTFKPMPFVHIRVHSIQREGKGASSDAALISPPRLMAARKMMNDRIVQIAAEEFEEGETAFCFGQP